MRSIFILFLSLLNCYILSAQVIDSRETIDLNGVWQFEQTVSAFPPQNFTRTIPVPGLIHLANPKIEEYEKFFQRPDKSEEKAFHSAYDINYTPKYSWYRKS